jgi:hypothetical protein
MRSYDFYNCIIFLLLNFRSGAGDGGGNTFDQSEMNGKISRIQISTGSVNILRRLVSMNVIPSLE